MDLLPDASEALTRFRGQYAYYCALAAERVRAGSHRSTLLTDPEIARAKRIAVQSAQMLKLIPGVEREDVLSAAREIRTVIGAEWFVSLPIVTEVSD